MTDAKERAAEELLSEDCPGGDGHQENIGMQWGRNQCVACLVSALRLAEEAGRRAGLEEAAKIAVDESRMWREEQGRDPAYVSRPRWAGGMDIARICLGTAWGYGWTDERVEAGLRRLARGEEGS